MRRGRPIRKKKDISVFKKDLDSIFEEDSGSEEISRSETFRLTDKDKEEILNGEPKLPKTKTGKILNFIKNHVRPDVGLSNFKEGERPDFNNENLEEIGEKFKKKLKVGLKLVIKF